MILIKNIDVYAPEHIGKKDILISGEKIYRINNHLDLNFSDCKTIDGHGKKIIPGLIDSHVHICGGGGEGGFKTRTPEIMLSQAVGAGVTTIIGVLGTDGTTRTMTNLIAKTKALKEEGLSAYCLTGSYEIPVRTLTNSITDDIVLIDEILGCGEIAISDHRSSHAGLNELLKLASASRLGGILSNKAGIINVHMGDDKIALKPLLDVLDNSAIPIKQFLPTHMNRNPYLFKDGIEYVKRGGFIDFTTSTVPEFLADGEIDCGTALATVISETGSCNNVIFSSDGQGSLPQFDSDGNLVRLKIGTCSSLFEAVKMAVENNNVPFEIAIKVATSNPADLFKLNKGYIKEGRDGDLLILNSNNEIETVIAKGKILMENKNILIKGTFEN